MNPANLTLQDLASPSVLEGLSLLMERHTSKRKAAEWIACQQLREHLKTASLSDIAKFDIDSFTLLAHGILNLLNKLELIETAARAGDDIYTLLLHTFPHILEGMTDEEQYSLFCHLWLGGGVRSSQNTRDNYRKLLPTLKHVRKLSVVRSFLKDLAKEYPRLVLYRGVAASNEAEAREKLLRPSWTVRYAPAAMYAHRWMKTTQENDLPYVAKTVVEVKKVYCYVYKWELSPYGYYEFLLETSKREFVIKQIPFEQSFFQVPHEFSMTRDQLDRLERESPFDGLQKGNHEQSTETRGIPCLVILNPTSHG